jgi:hypothetical protein
MFLGTMGAVLSVIDIEHDDLRGAIVGRDKLIYQHQRHTVQLGA